MRAARICAAICVLALSGWAAARVEYKSGRQSEGQYDLGGQRSVAQVKVRTTKALLRVLGTATAPNRAPLVTVTPGPIRPRAAAWPTSYLQWDGAPRRGPPADRGPPRLLRS